MPELRTRREQWVTEGLRALAAGGVDAVRVERLARGLGVTKGGFYGYFADRDDLLREMLDAWEQALLLEPMAVIDVEPGDGRQRLRRLFELAGESGTELLAVELAIRNWARHHEVVAARVARIDNRRTAYMRALFAEFCSDPGDVEGRCHLATTLFVGNQFVATTHLHHERADVLAAAVAHLLL
ncbi:MAG TPA: TetR/AcrR family transcriptional regulator [Galbitalea sp.]|jgi:AcrR family transcriptional regulator